MIRESDVKAWLSRAKGTRQRDARRAVVLGGLASESDETKARVLDVLLAFTNAVHDGATRELIAECAADRMFPGVLATAQNVAAIAETSSELAKELEKAEAAE